MIPKKRKQYIEFIQISLVIFLLVMFTFLSNVNAQEAEDVTNSEQESELIPTATEEEPIAKEPSEELLKTKKETGTLELTPKKESLNEGSELSSFVEKVMLKKSKNKNEQEAAIELYKERSGLLKKSVDSKTTHGPIYNPIEEPVAPNIQSGPNY